ncbi:hypothetical protein [Tepidibacter hydrothermalis]|uniref:hypothetical protein n=1 Tax=Tepidibacter hydrothermalis TaxID=3036126 RepID=UPI002F40B0AD
MANKIAVLSKRPATIKNIHEINLTVKGTKTPLLSREAPEFKDYFNTIWKELDIDGKDQLL